MNYSYTEYIYKIRAICEVGLPISESDEGADTAVIHKSTSF